MDTNSLQINNPGCSILGDMQVSLCDESMKRRVDQMEGDEHKKSKKRRSSMSSHRRSITGNVVPTFHIDSESGSQASTESCSQKSSTSDEVQSSQAGTEPKNLLPNPVNIQMDAIIKRMGEQITALDEEYKQWNNLLLTYEEKEEESKEQSMVLTLAESDIPADIKEFGWSEYIKTKPQDLCSLKKRLDMLLLQCKSDKEDCLQDVELITETVETVRNSNKYLSHHLLVCTAEEDIKETTDTTKTSSQQTDSRQIIINYLNS